MKFYESAFLVLSALALSSSASAQLDGRSSTSILICRSHQCAVASQSMTKGFLFNKLAQMIDQNIGKTVLICEADPTSHVCLQEGITLTGQSTFSPVNLTIRNFKLVDKKMLNGTTGLDLVLDYQVQAGSTFPNCQLGLSRLSVDYTDKVELATPDFACNITETGRTSLNATYNINYLDFDYGFIGAYYTIAAGESVMGDKTGYALFRFTAKPAVNFTFPKQPVTSELTYQKLSTKSELPEIVRETAPTGMDNTTGDDFGTGEDDRLPSASALQKGQNRTLPSSDETVTETTIRIVPEFPEGQTTQPVVELQPKVVKTITVERVLITPDGKRHVSPPEKRTFIDGLDTSAEGKGSRDATEWSDTEAEVSEDSFELQEPAEELNTEWEEEPSADWLEEELP